MEVLGLIRAASEFRVRVRAGDTELTWSPGRLGARETGGRPGAAGLIGARRRTGAGVRLTVRAVRRRFAVVTAPVPGRPGGGTRARR
ncbi:hypothetical protein Asi03nite_09830 [Actinoplanes siamensis]|uniref:Uncharacterized protein n=1 Tax=Actinoplanes siamensis TaxID=1223317 RepID=A0A919KCV6_9ACTN|nr:hypothetical protein Asi03nite_09830 [Actinoplanes siamensis]